MDVENITSKQFWKAISIWVKRPHVVNRRLSGIVQIWNYKAIYSQNCLEKLVNTCRNLEFETVLSEVNVSNKVKTSIFTDILNISSYDEFEDNLVSLKNDTQNLYLFVQKLLPRNLRYKDTFRICLLNLSSDSAMFFNIAHKSELIDLTPKIPYCIKLIKGGLSLHDMSDVEDISKLQWLRENLIPRLTKWTTSPANTNGFTEGSLNLISLDKYNLKYQELKLKYGQEMVKIWPENTDPAKFVYEDVAIATYLLLLWEEERDVLGSENKQSFIDLGCGNGLLVYILASEGHPGRGVDVRKRGIWDMYPNFVKLEVEPVTPSEECLYKDADWLIGNHSDELTPWVPVLAARSSYDCRFFLLPCCAYEFDGKKYQRHDSSKSQYNEYLEYVKEICEKCSIKTDIDRLKIPSTKRICFVGTDRLYHRENHSDKIKDIQSYIDSRCSNNFIETQNTENGRCSPNEHWVSGFVPRDGIEKVRNCTKIEKGLINEIVTIVATHLLKEKKIENNWNAGGCLPLNILASLISNEKLKNLKNECGGLQTLLRNHHHIFEVVSGNVKFRHPRSKTEVLKHLTKTQKFKGKKQKGVALSQKPCWFFNHHPDGCPLSADVCSYIHT